MASPTRPCTFEPGEVQQQIDSIVGSRAFAGKAQLIRLLRILFEHMDSITLKPDRVIQELWSDSKTKKSADLATEMNRLRKALDTYYDGEGKSDPIRIWLPSRTASARDGTKERRWIVAEPRLEKDAPVARPALPPILSLSLKILIVLCLLASGAFLLVGVRARDTQPYAGRLEGSSLIVTNAKGEELWRQSFSEAFFPDYYPQGRPRIWFGDLDGDGRSEVLFAYHPNAPPHTRSTTLICYSDRGKEKWRWVPQKRMPELDKSAATFTISGFAVMNGVQGSPRRIVVSSNHDPFYPGEVAILDPDGHLLSEYWHSGHLDYLTLADLDGDGRQEIIVAGVSNGYGQATLVVLDPDRVFGASSETTRPELQFHGIGAAQERLRLLFPRSDLNQALLPYNAAEEITATGNRVRILVVECDRPNCFIWYDFDNRFNLLSVTADDRFRVAHSDFYRNAKASHPLTKEEEAELRKVRCLVGCKTEFVAVDVPH